jgi:hypothetical protein
MVRDSLGIDLKTVDIPNADRLIYKLYQLLLALLNLLDHAWKSFLVRLHLRLTPFT